MTSDGYCARHGWIEGKTLDESCPGCADEVVAEFPEAASIVRRSRRWARAYTYWVLFVALAAAGGWYAFLLYREWRIWW